MTLRAIADVGRTQEDGNPGATPGRSCSASMRSNTTQGNNMAEKDALSTMLDEWEKEMIRGDRIINVLNGYKKYAYDESDRDPAHKDNPVERQYLQPGRNSVGSMKYAEMVREGTEAAIRSSPELQARYLEEIKAGRLTDLQLAPLELRSEGSYDPKDTRMYINPQTAMYASKYDGTNQTFAPHFRELVGTLGHEGDHSERRDRLLAETVALGNAANAVLNSRQPVHDFTGVVRDYTTARGATEARGGLEYYNSIVRSLDPADRTDAKIHDAIPPDRRAIFFDPATGKLHGGLTPEPSGSHLLPHTQKNVEALRETFFERGQPGVRESYESREVGHVVAELLKADTNAQKTVVNLKDLGIDYKTIQPYLSIESPNRIFYDNSDGRMLRLETGAQEERARSAPASPAMPSPGAGPRRPAMEDGDAEHAHPLYSQAIQHLRGLGPQGAGYTDAHELQRMAGSLADLAQQRNLRSIESVVPSTDGKGLIATWSNPGNPLDNDRVYMDKTAGANQPIEQSLQRLSASTSEREQRQELAAPQQNAPQIQGFSR